MEQIKNKSFGGERPLFGAHDVRLEDITITVGGMWMVPSSQTATSPQKAVRPSGIVITW